MVTPHPDINWTDSTWLPAPIRAEVATTFRWTLDE